MKKLNNTLLFLFLITCSFCVRLREQQLKQQRVTMSIEKNAEIAINRIKKRIDELHSTSCKVSAKFILLIVSEVYNQDNLTVMPLSKNIDENLQSIREKLDKGFVFQIEIKPNHHFVIFKKKQN